MTDRSKTRRQILLGLGAASTIALAGCGDGNGTETDGENETDGDTPTDGADEETETETMDDGTATEEPEDGTETEDGTEEQPSETANVRVAHMSPNAPNVDVYVDSEEPVLSDVPFGDVSGYLEVPAGERQVEITAAGDPDTSVFSGGVPVEADTDYSIVAAGEIGDEADQAFEPLVLEDDNSEVGSNDARLRAEIGRAHV